MVPGVTVLSAGKRQTRPGPDARQSSMAASPVDRQSQPRLPTPRLGYSLGWDHKAAAGNCFFTTPQELRSQAQRYEQRILPETPEQDAHLHGGARPKPPPWSAQVVAWPSTGLGTCVPSASSTTGKPLWLDAVLLSTSTMNAHLLPPPQADDRVLITSWGREPRRDPPCSQRSLPGHPAPAQPAGLPRGYLAVVVTVAGASQCRKGTLCSWMCMSYKPWGEWARPCTRLPGPLHARPQSPAAPRRRRPPTILAVMSTNMMGSRRSVAGGLHHDDR